MSRKLTPWFDGGVKPARKGVYRAQDMLMKCNCCWFDLHWDGSAWHSDGRRWFPTSNLRRWRGLAEKP